MKGMLPICYKNAIRNTYEYKSCWIRLLKCVVNDMLTEAFHGRFS